VRLAEILSLFQAHGLRPQASLSGDSDPANHLDLDFNGTPHTDNRLLNSGDIFICIKGFSTDGHQFIPDAIARGASLIVCEQECQPGLPSIRVTDTRKAAALLARLYFNCPSSSFRLVGVTGTNGKTSTSLIIFEALRRLGYKAGWIGTLGYMINDGHFPTGHTTPDIMELNRIFASMRDAEVSYVIMEVSSHAIALDRIYGIDFDLCLFTNLSRDHLDFHGSMEEYGRVKASFFEAVRGGKSVAVINIEDAFGAQLAESLKGGLGAVFTVGAGAAAYQIQDLVCDRHGTLCKLQTRAERLEISSALIGDFNARNLALAAAALHLLSFDSRDISSALATVNAVPGRMQSVPNQRGIGVFVDYAHTPDAIETVLKTCRKLPHNRVLCLMGAGGDRDQGKRPLMLGAALRYADAVIVTDDNPRTENPDKIILDIISGSHPDLPWWIIRDRALAIHSILTLAQPDDLVVICGKGHETYQEIAGVKHPFNDVEVASAWLNSAAVTDQEALTLPIDELLLRVLNQDLTALKDRGYNPPRSYKYISTDTRSIQTGSVFYALKGERFDAHAFLGKALDEPANFAIGELALPEHDRYLQVESSLGSMARLLAKYLAMFDIYKLALTGSTGKTSTKEFLANICASSGPTLKTLANENNLIGLCQTIRRVRPDHRFGVFELGTNHFGEIATMSDILNPDAALVINIGPSHLEAFGDEEGVYKEKSVLLRQPLQIRLFDGDDPRFAEFYDSGKGVGFSEACQYRISDLKTQGDSMAFKLGGQEYRIPSTVPHMAFNAAFGIAFGLEKGFTRQQIQSAVLRPLSLAHRLETEIAGDKLLIVDCYNANPVSMQRALEYWIALEAPRPHVAILGDMLELGDMAAGYHQMVGAIMAEMNYAMLITVGKLSIHYQPVEMAVKTHHFPDVEAAIAGLGQFRLPKGAVILIKASHGIHLEKLLPMLRKGV